MRTGWAGWSSSPGMVQCAKCRAPITGLVQHQCGAAAQQEELPKDYLISPKTPSSRASYTSPLAREAMFRLQMQKLSSTSRLDSAVRRYPIAFPISDPVQSGRCQMCISPCRRSPPPPMAGQTTFATREPAT